MPSISIGYIVDSYWMTYYFQFKYPRDDCFNFQLEWESYLTGLTYDMAEIKNTDTVAILHEDTLHKLCDVIKLYESSKENRT